MNELIHQLADFNAALVGKGTRIWQYTVILADARIGNDCNICSHCFIENDVVIGDRVTIKNGVYLYDGLRIEDDVFIGPNVTFTNDKFPRSKQYPASFAQTTIEAGASIGGGGGYPSRAHHWQTSHGRGWCRGHALGPRWCLGNGQSGPRRSVSGGAR